MALLRQRGGAPSLRFQEELRKVEDLFAHRTPILDSQWEGSTGHPAPRMRSFSTRRAVEVSGLKGLQFGSSSPVCPRLIFIFSRTIDRFRVLYVLTSSPLESSLLRNRPFPTSRF